MIVLGRAKVKAGTGHFDGAVRRGGGGESGRRGGADSGSVPKRLRRGATVVEERVERRLNARAGLAARM